VHDKTAIRASEEQDAGGSAALELVVAVSENDVIGRANQLPWRLPADLQRFKALTLGRNVLMGRKTFESIGKALPGRANFVLTRSAGFVAEGCTVVATLEEARRASRGAPSVMVIGGGEIYRQCLPLAKRIHLTIVHTRIEGGDAHFDGWHGEQWRESGRERHEPDARHGFAYSFVTLDRA
jgi:dihydrofolate reductase